jgi:hypothetical protein
LASFCLGRDSKDLALWAALPTDLLGQVTREKIMKMPFRFTLWLCFLILLLPGLVLGQSPESGTPKFQPPGMSLYNPQTVETVNGLVVFIAPSSQKDGMPERLHLTLKTDRETLEVFLGPSVFLEKQEVKIAALDKIQVTGSRVILQGKPAIIAAEIKKGEQLLKLRDRDGRPLWSGKGQR